jgi:hypothetical protein
MGIIDQFTEVAKNNPLSFPVKSASCSKKIGKLVCSFETHILLKLDKCF